MSESEKITKSTLERVLLETDVFYRHPNGQSLCDRCCDLSTGGIYLQTKSFLKVDEKVFISFSIPLKDRELEISCKTRVAWTNFDHDKLKTHYPPGIGLEFTEISREDLSILSDFIYKYDEDKKMNMICAWCGKHLGMRKGPYGKTSHGICDECKKNCF